jgi:hypothetical protein
MERINIKIDSENASATHTLKLWGMLPVTLRWLIYDDASSTPDRYNGKCIVIANGLAALVEGFITDLLITEYETRPLPNKEEILADLSNSAPWSRKCKRFEELFPGTLSALPTTEAIETLIKLRNNIAHGRTFREEVTYIKEDPATGEAPKHQKTIENDGYDTVKIFFVAKGLLKHDPGSISPTLYWNIPIVKFLYMEVKKFLWGIMMNTPLSNKSTLQAELEEAYQDDPHPWQ